MVYQNYNAESNAGLSEAGLNKMRLKEQKKKFKEAKKAAKDADKAAKYEADTLKKQRLKGARDILDKAGYTDVRVSNNMAPSAPACGASTYGAKVASANRKLKNDAMRAQAKPVRQVVPMRQAPVRQVVPARQAVARPYAPAPARSVGMAQSRPMGAAPARSYALAPARQQSARPVYSMAKKPSKPAYGYYSDGTRNVPVPITQQGTVRQDYLRAVNRGRPARAVKADRMQTASRVYPAKMTPAQAAPWMLNPGHGDVVGIDAPRSARPNMYASANAKRSEPAYLKYQVPEGQLDSHVEMKDSKNNTYYVKVTPHGKVSKDYLDYINTQRPKSAAAMDSKRTAVAVIRCDPTPYQAKPWIQNPGKYDVSGIDTVGSAVVPATISRPSTEEIAKKNRERQWKAAQQKGIEASKARAKARREAAGETAAETKKKTSKKATKKPANGKAKQSAPKAKAQDEAPASPQARKQAPKGNGAGKGITVRESDMKGFVQSNDGTGQTKLVTASANRKSAGKPKACGKKSCNSKSKSCNSKTACKGCSCNRK